MPRSVSLAAYLALARRTPTSDWSVPDTPRPDGPLVWAHAATASSLAALVQLAARFDTLDTEAGMILTGGDDVPRPKHLPPNVIWADTPPEHLQSAEAFLAHWRPDICVWSTGELRPALITSAGKVGLPMVLVDADETALEEARWRWLPDMSRGVVGQFGTAFACTANAARRLQRLGLSGDRIDITGPLQRGSPALLCNEEERSELSGAVAGRPVWLAGAVQPDELDVVLQSHRQAARVAHRLLLILVPQDEDDGPEIETKLHENGWRVAVWSKGELPTEATQILLADTSGDMGLWYRLAPIAFMGSSLTAGHGGSDPFAAAALGSAILYGPNMGPHIESYRRLAEGGAARIVRDVETLAGAVVRLTAPDQAAIMAQSAWAISTDGAEVTDRLLEVIQDTLDDRSGDMGAA
ncbi:MAG: 3-deoxy-D-manno-octulosonic acid transferase [Pseudooceanicola sp.]